MSVRKSNETRIRQLKAVLKKKDAIIKHLLTVASELPEEYRERFLKP